MENIETEVEELFSREAKEKRVLAGLLDRYSNLQGKFLATRGEMGVHAAPGGKVFRTPSYVVSHDLMWIATNVKMGSEMPFMESSINKETGKLEINESNVDELTQRKPDWSRQASLTAYLAHDKTRKFGSILAVISPQWVDDPQHENWGADKRALKSAAQFEPLDLAGRIGLLNIDDAFVYALDGQHRVMGLRGLKDLIENQFFIKSKDGDQKQRYSRDDFLREFDLELNALQGLMSERMHVEYVPAVLPGETHEEGSRRVRSVFVALNSNAKKPTKGENTLLDETDGYAIVARKAGVMHPLFKGAKGSRINWKSSGLPDRSEWYTTLEALRDMAASYLTESDSELAKSWGPRFKNLVRIRPSEDEIENATSSFGQFLTKVHNLPVFQSLEASDDILRDLGDYRAFPDEGKQGKGHLLLRPIGQIVLAIAVGKLVDPKKANSMSLDEVFDVISKLDKNGRFESHRPENLWYGVTYNIQKNKMDVAISNRKLAVDLLIYLVRGADEAERSRLLREVIRLREVEGKWRPFDGSDPIPILVDLENPDFNGLTLPVPRQ